jgi:hypothetical protein
MKKQNTLAILSIALLTPFQASAETCSSLPSCSDLGFVYTATQCDEDGLKKIKCPFGNYYFCSKAACTGYTLTSCPANGNCSICASGTTIKYKLDSCQSGYEQSGNTCQENDLCADYPGKGSSVPDSECILTYDWCPSDADRYQLTCIPSGTCALSADGSNCIGAPAQTCSAWWSGKSCSNAPGSLVTKGSQVKQSNCPLYLQGDVFVGVYTMSSGESLQLEDAGDIYDGCTDTPSISFTRITPSNGRNEIIADIPLTIMEMDMTEVSGALDLECFEGCTASLALTASQDLTLRAEKPSTFIIQCSGGTSVPCIIDVEGTDTSMVTIAPTGNMSIQDASGGYWIIKNGKATNFSNSKIKIQI